MAAGMAIEVTRLKTVLLDGMGTLLRLVPPVPALARALAIDETRAERAFHAEVAYYLEHQLEAFDTERLENLRERSAAVMAEAAGVAPEGALDALMGALRFEAFDDAAPALTCVRDLGLRLTVVSNWDCSLPDVLDDVGLLTLVDDVVSSAVVGAAKPDSRIFEAALSAAGCQASEALHVGDSPANDVQGARAAGIQPLLLARAGGGDLQSLRELPALLS
jgi:putative hydrolase of the HAD superfamily